MGKIDSRVQLVAWAALVSSALGSSTAHSQGLTVDDMLAMRRVSEPAVSPDGKLVAFTVRDTDLEENRGRTDIWLAASDGAWEKPLTSDPANDSSATWSQDGAFVYFLSSRSGHAQVWRIPTNGGESQQVTKLPVDVSGFKLFPDGRRLALAIDVYPEMRSLADSIKRDEEQAKSKVQVRAYDSLLYRHWDQWEDGKFSHIFLWTAPEAGGKADDAVDLMPALRTDSPTHPHGGMEEVSISPDGKLLAYVARVGGREIAWKTNTDVFLVDTRTPFKTTNLTVENKGYDSQPVFSPDGRSVAVLSMARAGYEADRQRIMLYDVASKKPRAVAANWDRSPASLTFSRDGKTLFTSADDMGNHALFAVDLATGSVKSVVSKGTSSDPRESSDRLLFVHDTLSMPAELFSVRRDGSELRKVTHLNDSRVKKIAWGEYEQFSFKGAHGDTVYGYVMKPAGFKAGQRVPVAMLVHGGPQGSFGDHFHYRWNPQAFAGHGFGVVFIDFHGSTGYGQAFTDKIRGDWGGAPYEDLMLGLDAALQKFTWLDRSRMAALGASYGGYMINWIAGKTDRFKALVCHDGNLDERFAYFDTEELWFPEWEHGTPWENPEGYEKHNPIDLVKEWKTPMLVIHGANDFRVVDTQGMATFTALQRRGIPSRFVHFPDENHWVQRPLHSKRWHEEVLGWLDRWVLGKK